MPKRIDLTGQRFGRLVVVECANYSDSCGSLIWHCRCECGGRKNVSSRSLNHGKCFSCGCLQKPDLQGVRYGSLVVVGLGNKRSKRGTHQIFKVKCDCGSEFDTWATNLKSGNTWHCGCQKRARRVSGTWKQKVPSVNTSGYACAWDGPSGRRVLLHRAIYEEIEGRPLQPFEEVHHKNGIRSDNRPENLELKVKPHGAGQDPADIVKADTPESKAACLKLAQMYAAAAGVEIEIRQ